MNKAFLFDMDGVLVDSENAWERFEEPFYRDFFGDDVASQMHWGPGMGIDAVYQSAVGTGARFDADAFARGFEAVAMKVYDVAPLTAGTDELVRSLIENGFKLGIVTNSPNTWVTRVVPRLPFADKLEVLVALKERPDLKHKPSPDGYLEAFKVLKASPARSFILEDSNTGIQAAKASGAYVIGYSGNLVHGYEQTGADAYADTMAEVERLILDRHSK